MNTYHEQSGLPTWILLLFAVQLVVFGALYYKSPSPTFLFVLATIALVGGLLVAARLSVQISPESIRYRFFPFHLRTHTIPWQEVAQAELLDISAIGDFAGWGIRYAGKHGWGYISAADYGLKLLKTDGSRLVISIKDKREFMKFVARHEGVKVKM